MAQPLSWSTLEEAAEWLTKETGEEWNPRRVLDRALQIEAIQPAQPQLPALTLLCAIPPRDFTIAQRREVPDSSAREPQETFVQIPWQPLQLFARHVREFLIFDEAIVDEAMGLVPGDRVLAYRGRIAPPLKVTLSMIRIAGRNLPLFASTAACAAAATATGSVEGDEYLASLFDPVTVAELEKMFPADGQWKRWAERAKKNGLIAARIGRARFNPYIAGMWFLRRGVPDWDQAHLFRKLANSLPLRSQDKREFFAS